MISPIGPCSAWGRLRRALLRWCALPTCRATCVLSCLRLLLLTFVVSSLLGRDVSTCASFFFSGSLFFSSICSQAFFVFVGSSFICRPCTWLVVSFFCVSGFDCARGLGCFFDDAEASALTGQGMLDGLDPRDSAFSSNLLPLARVCAFLSPASLHPSDFAFLVLLPVLALRVSLLLTLWLLALCSLFA